jgi:hypothetical protein
MAGFFQHITVCPEPERFWPHMGSEPVFRTTWIHRLRERMEKEG